MNQENPVAFLKSGVAKGELMKLCQRPGLVHDHIMSVEGCILTPEGAPANFFTEYKRLCDARWAEKAFLKNGPQVFLASRLGAPSLNDGRTNAWFGDAIALFAATNRGMVVVFFKEASPKAWQKEWAAIYHACTGKISSWTPAPMPAWTQVC